MIRPEPLSADMLIVASALASNTIFIGAVAFIEIRTSSDTVLILVAADDSVIDIVAEPTALKTMLLVEVEVIAILGVPLACCILVAPPVVVTARVAAPLALCKTKLSSCSNVPNESKESILPKASSSSSVAMMLCRSYI
jgi:hypothetical protein